MDEPTAANSIPDEELSARLAAYASALDPGPASLARLRSEAVRAAAAASTRRARPSLRLVGPFRRPLVAFAAAALLVVLVVGGAFAAAAPGGPLYGTRLWLETITLPTAAGPRADAEIGRLDERLAEAEAAAHGGNGGAVAAALDAYRATVDAALAAAGGDPMREQHLRSVLERHRAVLEALIDAEVGNANASTAIQGALDRSASTIDRILSETPAGPGSNGQPGGAGQGPSAAPGQGGGNGAPGQGGGASNAPGQGGGNGQGPSAAPGKGSGASNAPGQGGGNGQAPSAAPGKGGPTPSKSPRP